MSDPDPNSKRRKFRSHVSGFLTLKVRQSLYQPRREKEYSERVKGGAVAVNAGIAEQGLIKRQQNNLVFKMGAPTSIMSQRTTVNIFNRRWVAK
jgi:hypothetical protein